MTQNEFSVCKAAEGGDAVASLTDDNKELKLLADGNSGSHLAKCKCVSTLGLGRGLKTQSSNLHTLLCILQSQKHVLGKAVFRHIFGEVLGTHW